MRVLLADDHALFRHGMRSLLEARGVEVIGEARNGREAVSQTRRLSPDVVLMDLNMPELDGQAVRWRLRGPTMRGALPSFSTLGRRR